MEKRLLPIGTVVLLKEANKKIMIYGRKQDQINEKVAWDYIACLYPEGNINENYTFLFNHEQIEKIYFMGFQDEEEDNFQLFLQTLEKP